MLRKNVLIVVLVIFCVALLGYSVGFNMGRSSAVEDGIAMLYDKSHNAQLPAPTELAVSGANDTPQDNTEYMPETVPVVPALSAEQLSSLQLAVTETLQQQLATEFKLALAAIEPQQSSAKAPAEIDPATAQQVVDETHALLDAAIERGSWSSEDEQALTEALQTVPGDEIIEVNRRLSQAINEGQLEIDPQALFGMQ